MKNRWRPLLGLSMMLCIQVNGQGTFDYFANDPIWGLGGACNPGGVSNCFTSETINHYVLGDTMVEGQIHHKLFARGIVTTYWTWEPPTEPCDLGTTTYDGHQVGHLRQDDTRIYWKSLFDDQEQLLFEFDLNVGDTLPHTMYTSGFDLTVSHRDTIVVAGNERIRLTIGNGDDHLIEGIGSEHAGLLGYHGVSLGCNYFLHCYGYGSATYFPVEGTTCDIGLSIPHQQLIEMRIHPNPTTGPIELSLPTGPYHITIMNTMGAIVGTERAIGPASVRSDLSALPAGVYLIRVERNGMAITSTRIVRE